MIAVATQSLALNKLPFGWFDVALVAVLGFGLFRGRRNGMTKEVLPMFHWVVTVLVCGLAYEVVGRLIINLSGWSALTAYLVSYFSLMFVVYLLFHLLKQVLMPRLTGSNFFGSGEYYLGMSAGLLRFASMLFVGLALLNAPYYTAADIASAKAFNARWYGGGQQGYSGDFFPSLQSVQAGVFEGSFTGKYIKEYADVMLVNTGSSDAKQSAAPPKPPPVMHIGS